MNAGKKISLLRTRNNITQTEMSNLLGVKQSTLSQIENGKIEASLIMIGELAQKFKTPIEWFFDENFSDTNIVNNNIENSNNKNELWTDKNGKEAFLPFLSNLLNDNFDIELQMNYKRLSLLRNQILTMVTYMKEKTDYNFSDKEIQMLNLVDDFLNDDTNGILRLMDDGRKQYNNALKQYILSTEEYLSMLIDYLKFEIKKPLKNFKELK